MPFVDRRYDLVNSQESTAITDSGLAWIDVTDVAYGATGDGSTDDASAITSAASAAANGTLFFPAGTYRIASNVTIGATVKVVMNHKAIIKPVWGKVFTISGTLDAGNYQIFDDNNGVGTDGTFTTDTGNWTKGAGWTIDAGDSNVAAHDGTNTEALSYAGAPGVASKIFMLKYTIGGSVNGGITPSIGGVSGKKRYAAGTYVETITAIGTGALTFTPELHFGGTIDNVEVYMLNTHVIAKASVETIIPQWWGATGDDATDNSMIFNKALANIGNIGTMFIPAGIYRLNTPVWYFPKGYNGLPTQGFVLKGAGLSETILKYMGSDAHYAIETVYEGHYVIGGADTVSGTIPGYITISDMQIQADSATADGGGIKLGCGVHSTLKNLAFLSIATGNAIKIARGRVTMTDSGHVSNTSKDFSTSGAGTASKYGIKFVNKTGVAGYLKSVTVRMKKTGSPEGTIAASLHANTSSKPGAQNGSSSNSVNLSALSTSEGLVTFTFPYSASTTYPTLVSATTYWIVLTTTGYTYEDGVTEVVLMTKGSDTTAGFATYDDDADAWGTGNDGSDLSLVVAMGQSLINYIDSCYVGSSGVATGFYLEDDSQAFVENCDILADNCIVMRGSSAYLNVSRSQISCGASDKGVDAIGGTSFFHQCCLEGGGTAGEGYYFDGGEHSFSQITGGFYPSWTAGTIIHYGDDITHRYPVADDPTFRMNTKYIVAADDDRVYHYSGTVHAEDADALSGNCIQSAASADGCYLSFGTNANPYIETYLPRGAYLCTIYAKDTKQVTNDFRMQVGWTTNTQNYKTFTLTASYKPYRMVLYVGTTQRILRTWMNYYKATANTNTISVSHFMIEYLGPDTLHVEELVAHNVTGSNADNARESRVHFIGRKEDGTLSELVELKSVHDGEGDDEKGKFIVGINDGDDKFAPTNRFQINAAGDVVLGSQAALATNATTGFVHVPSMAGSPSGAVTNTTGKVALAYDTTNHRLYIRDGSSWYYVALGT